MRKEAMMVLPRFSNDSKANTLLERTAAIRALVKAFGGVTLLDGQGHWFDENELVVQAEPVVLVYTAYDPMNRDADTTMRQIARKFAVETRQKEMYVRLASGEVQLLDTRPLWAAAA